MSLLRRSTSSPLPARTPRLHAWPKPAFFSFRSKVTPGRAARSSAVPSVEALSTTMQWVELSRSSDVNTESTQRAVSSAVLWVGMTTSTSGTSRPPLPQAAPSAHAQPERRGGARRQPIRQRVPGVGADRAGPDRAIAPDTSHDSRHVPVDDGLAETDWHLERGNGDEASRAEDAPLPEDIAAPEARQVVLAAGAGAEGCGVLVHAPRAGREGTAPAEQPQPQHEVDVLPVGEEGLVEAAHIEEGAPIERGRGGARPDRVGHDAVEH